MTMAAPGWKRRWEQVTRTVGVLTEATGWLVLLCTVLGLGFLVLAVYIPPLAPHAEAVIKFECTIALPCAAFLPNLVNRLAALDAGGWRVWRSKTARSVGGTVSSSGFSAASRLNMGAPSAASKEQP